MGYKDDQIARVQAAINALNADEATLLPKGEEKKNLTEICRKGTASFGLQGDTTPGFKEAKALIEGLKAVQRRAFTTDEGFMTALKTFAKDTAIPAFQALLEGVMAWPDTVGAPDPVTGNAGTRNPFFFMGKQSTEIVKGFVASKFINPVATDGVSLASAYKNYLQAPVDEGGLGLAINWDENKGNNSPFWNLYRHTRQTMLRRVAELKGETPPKSSWQKKKEAQAAAAPATEAPPVVAKGEPVTA